MLTFMFQETNIIAAKNHIRTPLSIILIEKTESPDEYYISIDTVIVKVSSVLFINF